MSEPPHTSNLYSSRVSCIPFPSELCSDFYGLCSVTTPWYPNPPNRSPVQLTCFFCLKSFYLSLKLINQVCLILNLLSSCIWRAFKVCAVTLAYKRIESEIWWKGDQIPHLRRTAELGSALPPSSESFKFTSEYFDTAIKSTEIVSKAPWHWDWTWIPNFFIPVLYCILFLLMLSHLLVRI